MKRNLYLDQLGKKSLEASKSIFNLDEKIKNKVLYDYIKIGIDKNITILNFGRTASEIKSSVGAIPQDLTIYFRHKKRITNRILHLFLQRVQPTGFQQKFPFKDL